MGNKDVKMAHASLFSGIGGAELAASWMGWDNKFHCEINPFCRKILEYHFPESISYEDISKTDFSDWRGKIDVLTGGFPCQPFSLAGKRKGAEDNRYLWPQMLRAIREIRPTWVVGENVAGILTMVQPGEETEMGFQTSIFGEDDRKRVLQRQEYATETICRDLEREGYSVQPFVIPACAVGAPHRRDRVWFIAHADEHRSASSKTSAGTESCRREYFSQSCEWRNTTERIDGFHRISRDAAHTRRTGREELHHSQEPNETPSTPWSDWEELPALRWTGFPTTQPVIRGGDDGIPFNVDDLAISFAKWRQESIKAYGNAWVPQVAYEIFMAIGNVMECK